MPVFLRNKWHQLKLRECLEETTGQIDGPSAPLVPPRLGPFFDVVQRATRRSLACIRNRTKAPTLAFVTGLPVASTGDENAGSAPAFPQGMEQRQWRSGKGQYQEEARRAVAEGPPSRNGGTHTRLDLLSRLSSAEVSFPECVPSPNIRQKQSSSMI